MRRLRIGVVNTNFTLGGVEKVSITLAQLLHDLFTYDVILIDFLGIHPFAYQVDKSIKVMTNQYRRTFLEKVVALMGQKKYQFTKKPYSIAKGSKSRIKGLANLIKEQNLEVVIMSQGYLTALIPALKKLLPTVKFVAWQHTTYEIYMKQDNLAFLPEYVAGLEAADVVVSLTKADSGKFKKHNPTSVGIYNPVLIGNIDNKVTNLNNKTLLYVGRLDYYGKGIDLLLEIMVHLPSDWKLLLVGDGSDEAIIKNKIQELELKEKVILAGFADEKKLATYYVQSDILLSTSRWEGFGLTILEAMTFGLPVVAFDNGGPKEILDNGEYGVLVEKENIKMFQKELENLIKSRELREVYQKKSLERMKKFDTCVIMKEWKLLLNKL